MLGDLPEKHVWDKLNRDNNPFRSFEFMDALKSSSSIGPEPGWVPLYVKAQDESFLYTFLKNHSYGEFIFDWSWAEAYERQGIPYYPKFTSMIPFTPVNTTPFVLENDSLDTKNYLLKSHDESVSKSNVSGAHFLFIQEPDLGLFREHGYLIRESLQYHFQNNDFKNFEDFLATLKTKKAKNLSNERNFPGIKIRKYTGTELNQDHADRMFEYYLSTIENKYSYAYLKRDFFRLIFKNLSHQTLFIEASNSEGPVAGSLFFYDHEKLYGRYWGANTYIPNLHFEMCYYQGMDFLFEKKLKVFEAGAQGEHKIARGFRPTIIHSAHKLKNLPFHEAVKSFIEREKIVVRKNQEDLMRLMPFR